MDHQLDVSVVSGYFNLHVMNCSLKPPDYLSFISAEEGMIWRWLGKDFETTILTSLEDKVISVFQGDKVYIQCKVRKYLLI